MVSRSGGHRTAVRHCFGEADQSGSECHKSRSNRHGPYCSSPGNEAHASDIFSQGWNDADAATLEILGGHKQVEPGV